MFSQMDFWHGVVVYNDLDISGDIPLEDQVDQLKEDLLQVSFSDKFLLDIGWYPSFSIEGCFKATVIQNFNWSEPVREVNVKTVQELKVAVVECVQLVKSLISSQ